MGLSEKQSDGGFYCRFHPLIHEENCLLYIPGDLPKAQMGSEMEARVWQSRSAGWWKPLMATLWCFYLLFPYGCCLQSSKGPAVFSLDGSMAALAGRHPSVQAGAECRAVRSGFLLGRCGLSRRYGVVAHHCAAALSCP